MIRTLTLLSALGVMALGAPTARRTVTVQAYDFRFDAPSSIPAGTVTIQFQNKGKEAHHLWIVELTGGKTPEEFTKAMTTWGSQLRMPSWAVEVGGPNSADPGKTADGTLTLEPGTYMLVCWVPSADGMLHAMKGMIKPLTVVAQGATKPDEPKADVNLTLDDYNYTTDVPITPGRHVVRIENRASQSHEVVIGRLHPDRTLHEATIWMNSGQVGPAPVTALGGASGLAKGRHMFVTLDFAPGRYVMLCYIPDAQDGKPHSDHGMIKEIEVK
jgi:uncharacterized cupredoxin-like copper-binding protein